MGLLVKNKGIKENCNPNEICQLQLWEAERKHGNWSFQTWVQTLPLPFPHSVTLDEAVNLPEQNEGPEDPHRVGGRWSSLKPSTNEGLLGGQSAPTSPCPSPENRPLGPLLLGFRLSVPKLGEISILGNLRS